MSEISIKSVCCTCLSTDRKLYLLCRLPDGINLLYMLLVHDPDAYKEGFYKDSASLRICWECGAVIARIKRFQAQACITQKQLTLLADGRCDVKLQTFSCLSATINTKPNFEFRHPNITVENFIDCGLIKDIKPEIDSDDTPLSVFYYDSDEYYESSENKKKQKKYIRKSRKKVRKSSNECNKDLNLHKPEANVLHKETDIISKEINESNKETNVTNKQINVIDKESNEFDKETNKPITNDKDVGDNKSIEIQIESEKQNCNAELDIRQSHITHTKAQNIEYCTNISGCKSDVNLKRNSKYQDYFSKKTMNENEMRECIEKRTNAIINSEFKCVKCVLEFKNENDLTNHSTNFHENKNDNHRQCDICQIYIEDLPTHRQKHYEVFNCLLCEFKTYTRTCIIRHLKENHKEICGRGNKRKRLKDLKSDEISHYPCPECNQTFHNKDLRWKHIQRVHREGFKCKMCDKKFAFKNNLERHERIHAGPLPRQECPTCNKMIRVDLLNIHSRIHTDRQKHACVECDKTFVSRATYENHLKYAQAHATVDVFRHKCPSCHRQYRSRGELQDHIEFHHKGQAQHKCPICGKGLATKRCIKRHIKRTHEGIKESAKDKICQLCGKAFRDSKGLIEHERIHSGVRPLSCTVCGKSFRQRSALCVHVKRMHTARGGS